MSSSLRVCIVTGFGQGARSYAENLAKALARKGHDVLWLCDPFWTGPEIAPREPRVEVIHANRSKFEYTRLGYLPLRSLRVRHTLHEILKRFRPDIVHALDPTGVLLSRNRVPLVATIHHPAAIDLRFSTEPVSQRPTTRDRLAWALLTTAERMQAKRSDLILTVSKWSRDSLSEFYGIPPHKLAVVRNGIDVSAIQMMKKAANSHAEDDEVTILHVGRNSPRKRIPFLIRAFSEAHSSLPLLRLRIVGADDASLRGFVDSLGLSNVVSFLPYLSQEQLYHELFRARIFATASSAEGFSYVTLEAMAAGIPVVVPNNSAFPELVTNDAEGLLFPSHSTHHMATCLRTLGEDEARRRRMGLNGQKVARASYSLDSFGAGIEQAYETALAISG